MTEQTNTTRAGSKPSHHAYHVRDIGDDKSFWSRIGAVWTNRNGGFTVLLDCVPLDGRIVCQPVDKPEQAQ